MKAQDFVKEKFPKAHAERYKVNGPIRVVYYLIWDNNLTLNRKRIGEGNTESKAWTDAKRTLLNKI